MRIIFSLSLSLLCLTCFSQTKLISHRSHSGSNNNFRRAVEHNLFDIENSNFGLSIQYVEKVDSVVLKSPNTILISRKKYRIINGKIDKTTKTTDTVNRANSIQFFKAKSIDSLKKEIKRTYKLINLDSAKFIGFSKVFKSIR